MRYKLVVKSFPREASHIQDEWTMEAAPVTIGRGEHCQIHLPDPRRLVSTNHVTIRETAGNFVAVDMSANGTKLNEQTLEKGEEYPLHDYDILDCCDFVLEFHPLSIEPVESGATDDIGKTVMLGGFGRHRFEFATGSLRLLYKDIQQREPDVRQEMLLGALRTQTQGMGVLEADQFLRYVEATFPEPEMQCAQVLQDPLATGNGMGNIELASSPSEGIPSWAEDHAVPSSSSVGTLSSAGKRDSQQQEVLTHLFEFLVTYEKGRQQFQKEFFGKDLTRYLGGSRNHIKWAAETVEIERYLFSAKDDQEFTQRIKELDEVLLAFHRHPLGILKGFYKSLDGLLDQFSPTLIQQELQETSWYRFLPFRAHLAWRRVQEKYWVLNEERQGLVKKFLAPYMEEGYCEEVHNLDV